MTVWDEATAVENIALYYDFGGLWATIYGNERHYVAINISFNVKKGTETLDISDLDLSQHVQLVNYESSKPLIRGNAGTSSDSLFYNQECSGFKAQLIAQQISQPTPNIDKTKLRALVRFHVYANAESDFTSNIAVRFLLPSGDTKDTSAGNSPALKLSMKVLRPIIYSTSDVCPLEWHFIREIDDTKVYNAFIRPKDESRFWKKNEFNRPDKTDKLVIAHIYIQDQVCHIFHVASLGPPVSSEINFSDVIPPVAYNSVTGALTVIKQIISRPSVVAEYNFLMNVMKESRSSPLKVRLYDQFGNVGALSLTWEDPKNPKLLAVSPDF